MPNRIESKPTQNTQKPVSNEPARASFTSNDTYLYNPEYHQFADALGVDAEDKRRFRVAKRLAHIYDWTGAEDLSGAIDRAKKLQKQLGVTQQGESLVNQMYKFIRLDSRRRQAKERLDAEYGEKEPNQEREKPATSKGSSKSKVAQKVAKDASKDIKKGMKNLRKEIRSSMRSKVQSELQSVQQEIKDMLNNL